MPRKSLLLLLFFCLLNTISFSQSGKIKWSERTTLTSSDFSIRSGDNYIDITLAYSYSFEPRPNRKFAPIIEADVTFNKQTSSLSDSSVLNLIYAQIIFDIEGYASKVLKLRVYQMGELTGPHDYLTEQMEHLISEVNLETSLLRKNFYEDVESRHSDQTLINWRSKIKGMIQNIPTINNENRIQNWSVGPFIGVGRHFLTSTAKNYFTDATSINCGLELDVKKSRIGMDVSWGFNKSRNYLESRGIWQPGTSTILTTMEFTYGRKFLKRGYLMAPYLGLLVNEFTPRRAKDEDDRKLTGYGPVLGIEMNYRLMTYENEVEKASFFIKGKLSLYPTNFVKEIRGPQINLRISVGCNASLKRRRLSISSKQTGVFL